MTDTAALHKPGRHRAGAWLAAVALLLAALAVAGFARPAAATIPAGSGMVTGRVSYAGTHPVENVVVEAYASGASSPTASSTTTPEGIYSLTLPAGSSWNLRVSDPRNYWETAWFGSTDGTRTTSTEVQVADGSTTTLDQQVEPIRSVLPRFNTDVPQWHGSYRLYARKYDPETGSWSAQFELTDKVMFGYRIEPGTYRFLFEPTYTTAVTPTWYPNQTSFEAATDVDTSGSDPTIFLDFDLVMAQSIGILSPASIAGTGWVGEQLTGGGPSWSVAPSSTSSRWIRDDGVVVADQTYRYTPTSGDYGHTILFEVTGYRPGYEPGTSQSAPITVTDLLPVTAPTVAGASRVGSLLTAKTGTWTHPVQTASYQWLRNGTVIAGGTSRGYRTTSADIAKKMSVRVTVSTADGHAAARTAALGGYVKTNSWISAVKQTAWRDGRRVTYVVGTLHLPSNPTTSGTQGRFGLYAGTRLLTTGRVGDGAPIRWQVPTRRGDYSYRFDFTGNQVAVPATRRITITIG